MNDAVRAARSRPRIRRVRDLTLIEHGDDTWVVACDSIGGIGPKPQDAVSASHREVAYFAVRVPLLELLAAGAEPVVIADTLCVEMDPTGIEMIAEIRRVAREVGLDPDVAVTGSTEDNVPTVATGVGVTVIGCVRDRLRPGTARVGQAVVCLGFPRSAPHDTVMIDDPVHVGLNDVRALHQIDGVTDIVPVGSHGVAFEIEALAHSAGLVASLAPQEAVDLTRSGGPATVVLAAIDPSAIDAVRAIRPDLPVTVVATLEEQP